MITEFILNDMTGWFSLDLRLFFAVVAFWAISVVALIRRKSDMAIGMLLVAWLLAELRACDGLIFSSLCISCVGVDPVVINLKRMTIALVAPLFEIIFLTFIFIALGVVIRIGAVTVSLHRIIGVLCGLAAILLLYFTLLSYLFQNEK